MTEYINYELRCSLAGHTGDVRGVATGEAPGGKLFLASGSRDRTCKVWMPGDKEVYEVFQNCEGHTNFISCVCIVPPNEKHPEGLILTGGHDHTILGYELGKLAPVYRLVGHHGTVCSIIARDSIVVSGSWDKTAKVWAEQENIATLEGHEAAVWAVAYIGEGILTASADQTIRLWINRSTLKVFKGHTDCVRGLAVVDSNRFLSCSNDATIRLWNVQEGDTIQVYYGHTNFIYSVALLPNSQDFFSVGEDRTLRVWKGNENDCKQVIHLPATSVWCVACMKNGDVVTGSNDGIIRIFTNAPERKADAGVLAAFQSEVSDSVIASGQELGGMKLTSLPGPEALLKEGKKDGGTIMVREGTKVACYAWSASEKKWNKIGDVVGASGATQNTSGRVLHEGEEYDYVFRVDLDDNTSLKLPYNITEDPWFAAQKFIHKNNLSQGYLDQVANFIVTNTKGMTVGTASSGPEFTDPFTGGNRYVPGSAINTGLPQVGSGGAPDPFTGSGAYTTSSVKPAVDQFQGSISNESLSLNVPHFPSKKFLQFTQPPNYDALRGKLNEFIQGLGPNAVIGEDTVDILLEIGKSGRWDSTVEQAVKICLNWPQENIFPILDLLRVGVLNPTFAVALNNSMTICGKMTSTFVSPQNATNQMLMLKLLCNVFGVLTDNLMESRSFIVSQLLSHLAKAKQNHVGAATLFLNYSIVVTDTACKDQNWCNIESQTEVLMTAVNLLDMLTEGEAIYRLLIGIGNIIYENPVMINLFKSLSSDTVLKNLAQFGILPKIQVCAKQIIGCLGETN